VTRDSPNSVAFYPSAPGRLPVIGMLTCVNTEPGCQQSCDEDTVKRNFYLGAEIVGPERIPNPSGGGDIRLYRGTMSDEDINGDRVLSVQRIYCTPRDIRYFTLTALVNDREAVATFYRVIEQSLQGLGASLPHRVRVATISHDGRRTLDRHASPVH